MMTLFRLLEAMSTPQFYNQITGKNFSSKETFPVRVPFKMDGRSISVVIPVTLKMNNLEKDIDDYLKAPPELRQKFDTYAYWYDNFNKLIFDNMGESDACLFLVACAFCSANTALDQNILEAAKLFEAVKSDFADSNKRVMLGQIAGFAKDNMNNEILAKLKPYVDQGSAYAALITPKKDYKGGVVQQGPRKGQEDIFSEITVSNAKLPNFNKFVQYYLKNNGVVAKDKLVNDFKNGEFEIGGTKIGSFFMNLVAPGYKWEGKVDPATVDRWMIRVFFDEPLRDMVEQDITDWIEVVSSTQEIKPSKTDTPIEVNRKRYELIQRNKSKIVENSIMQLFSSDVVRQNLVKIMNEHAKRLGLTSFQLQALAWVNIRKRYNAPAAKFTKFEDVMDYAEQAAKGIMDLDPNVNKIVHTIKVLSSGPRFKFKDQQDVVDTIKNRDNYEKVYNVPPKNDPNAKVDIPPEQRVAAKKSVKPVDDAPDTEEDDDTSGPINYESILKLPPKVDVENKLQVKIPVSLGDWNNMRVALADTGKSASVFDLSVSTKDPVKKLTGSSRRNSLRNALKWILTYKPVKQPAA